VSITDADNHVDTKTVVSFLRWFDYVDIPVTHGNKQAKHPLFTTLKYDALNHS